MSFNLPKYTIDTYYESEPGKKYHMVADIYEIKRYPLTPNEDCLIAVPFIMLDNEPMYIKIKLGKFRDMDFSSHTIISCAVQRDREFNTFELIKIFSFKGIYTDSNEISVNKIQRCDNCGAVIFTNEPIQCCDYPKIRMTGGNCIISFEEEEDIDNMDNKLAGDAINRDSLMKEAQKCIDAIKASDGSVKDLSDGYHTFGELYNHRALLFASLCMTTFKHCAWKSLLHHSPEDPMFDKMFIVGIETPYGQATYHYNIDPYWSMFQVKELPRAPKFDGHTPDDAINRIYKYAMDIATKPTLRRDNSIGGMTINLCGDMPKND